MEGIPHNPIKQAETPRHFEFSHIQNEHERQEFMSKYNAVLREVTGSIDELKNALCIEDNGIDEGSQHVVHKSMSEISHDVESSSRENVDYLEEAAQKLAYTFNAIEYSKGIAEPENMTPMLKGYEGTYQAFEETQRFLKELEEKQPAASLSETSAKLGGVMRMIEEEHERMTARIRLADEYYGR